MGVSKVDQAGKPIMEIKEAAKKTVTASAATAVGLSCLGVGGMAIAFFALGVISQEVLVAGILVGLFGALMTSGGTIGLSLYPKALYKAMTLTST